MIKRQESEFLIYPTMFATSRFPNTYFFVKALKRLERSILSFTRCYVTETIHFNVFSSPYDEPLFFLNVHIQKVMIFFHLNVEFLIISIVNNQKLNFN